MSKETIARLLKLVVIFAVAVLAFAGLWLLPRFLNKIDMTEPYLHIPVSGIMIYINLSFLPVYACLVMAWQVFTTIGRDECFCEANVKRLRRASILAILDVLLVIAFTVWMMVWHVQLTHPFTAIMAFCMVLLGLCASIICFALSKLVAQAAEYKQDLDLTI